METNGKVETNGKGKERGRRTGSLTLGAFLIVVGAACMVHALFPAMADIRFLARFWPLALIFLGMEILEAGRDKN